MATRAGTLEGGEAKAALILAGIAISESVWVYWSAHLYPARFLRYAGFGKAADAGFWAWGTACLVTIAFVYFSLHLPSVKANLFRFSWLKLLAVLLAVAAGFCEEIVFRKLFMDFLQHKGLGVVTQIIGSGFAFGFAHAVWGLFRGSIRAAMGAMIATGGLGLALALVYVLANRIVLPCIVAHFLINLLIEPGLVLAAVRGEMSASRT
ncbi:MAG TPA: CPBP family intramembrane glutamic endopeptidase [Candidatus Angelobacter sp.]|nr:CPBP family intramembrane glutamic endopeptidase [Candidatus Angelobacter sp.]